MCRCGIRCGDGIVYGLTIRQNIEMSILKNDKKYESAMGRPASWPEATSAISQRLQAILPKIGKAKLAGIFFTELSEKGVDSILSGKTEPSPSALLRIARVLNVDLDWLAWGKVREERSAPQLTADGIASVDGDLLDLCMMTATIQERISRMQGMALRGDLPKEEFASAMRAVARSIKTVMGEGMAEERKKSANDA